MICYLSRSALLHHLDEVNQVTEVYCDRIILLGVHTLLLLVLLINSKMYNSYHTLNKHNTLIHNCLYLAVILAI